VAAGVFFLNFPHNTFFFLLVGRGPGGGGVGRRGGGRHDSNAGLVRD
jgi:hypothetical protein